MMFDFDAHYIFNYLDQFEFYGLGGLNISFVKSKYLGDEFYPENFSDNGLGLNIGAGTYMKFSEQFVFFGEIKYIFTGFNFKYDQLVVTIGVLLNVQWLKQNE